MAGGKVSRGGGVGGRGGEERLKKRGRGRRDRGREGESWGGRRGGGILGSLTPKS